MTNPNHPPQGPSKYTIFIDNDKYEVEEPTLTVAQLLSLAGANPAEYQLAQKDGNKVVKYSNLDETIELKNGLHFFLYFKGPTSVS